MKNSLYSHGVLYLDPTHCFIFTSASKILWYVMGLLHHINIHCVQCRNITENLYSEN